MLEDGTDEALTLTLVSFSTTGRLRRSWLGGRVVSDSSASVPPSRPSCHTLFMYDSYGAAGTVKYKWIERNTGLVMATGTLDSGSKAPLNLYHRLERCYDLTISSGIHQNEVSWSMIALVRATLVALTPRLAFATLRGTFYSNQDAGSGRVLTSTVASSLAQPCTNYHTHSAQSKRYLCPGRG